MTQPPPRIAIVGAGPIGIEAALAAAERGWPFTVYESAPSAGGHVREWGHVRLFTPWAMTLSPRVRSALGERAPDGAGLPTGDDLADQVLEPAAASLGERLKLGTRVLAIAREGLLKHEEISSAERGARPFRLLVRGPGGDERVEHADAVLDCTGTWGEPNALGDGGIPAPGEAALADRIEHGLPDFDRDARDWAGRRILLTGSGHSAQTAARDLAALAREAPETEVVWAVRGGDRWFGAVEDDPLPARAELNAEAADLAAGASDAVRVQFGAVTERVAQRDGRLVVALRNGSLGEVAFDRVLALNGGTGDASLYRQLQVHECYATAAPMKLSAALLAQSGDGPADCLALDPPGPETLVNPEPGFFILGAKSYGRNSQFLLQVGWQQVDDAFGLIAAR
jgi:cation diffusion facilitator CzcD-associated flavoprotein CzcO